MRISIIIKRERDGEIQQNCISFENYEDAIKYLQTKQDLNK